MEVQDLPLSGLKLIKPRVFKDERGFFLETFSEQRYLDGGVATPFVQDNHSRSTKGTLRGLHLQSSPGQAKLVRCGRGRIFDVAVDVRPSSRTFKRWVGIWLDDHDHHQLYVPVGFAHGFLVASDVADVMYRVSSPYDAATETGFRFDDPAIGVEWPLDGAPLLSARDQGAQSFDEYLAKARS